MDQILNKVEKDINFKYSSCNDFVRQYQCVAEEAYIHLSGIYNSYDTSK